jgi:hypothetical protein
VAWHQREVERRAVEREGMAAQAQRLPVLALQLALVAHRAQRLVAGGFQPRLQVVGRHRSPQAAQVFDQRTQLVQQRVGGEVAVHLRHVAELRHAPRHAVEDARGRIAERLHAALARFQQRLAAR